MMARPYRPAAPRWSHLRKMGLLIDLRRGRVLREVALREYGLTEEELASWERRFARWGAAGLKQTQIQALRA